MEIRIKDVIISASEKDLKIGGYINVTERESEILYNKRSGKWFKESMRKGVFEDAIKKSSNIPLLYEHNWNKKLAETRNSTLTLIEDNIGLKFEAVIEDRTTYKQVQNGEINACSFGFKTIQDEFSPINDRLEKRTVNAIELLEVSLVKNPAYVGSLAEVRAYEEAEKKAKEEKKEETSQETEESVEPKDKSEDTKDKSEDTKDESKEDKSKEDDKESKDKEEDLEDDEKREIDSVFPSEESKEEVETPNEEVQASKEDLKQIIDEIIEEKLNQIKVAETVEEEMSKDLEYVKQQNKEIEDEILSNSMRQSYQVVKLRLDLLKLKTLKEGI